MRHGYRFDRQELFQFVSSFTLSEPRGNARNRQEECAMLAKHDVAVRMAVLLLPGLLYACPPAPEGARDSNRSSNTSEQSKLPRAPVGHRQPTTADIPKDLPK